MPHQPHVFIPKEDSPTGEPIYLLERHLNAMLCITILCDNHVMSHITEITYSTYTKHISEVHKLFHTKGERMDLFLKIWELKLIVDIDGEWVANHHNTPFYIPEHGRVDAYIEMVKLGVR